MKFSDKVKIFMKKNKVVKVNIFMPDRRYKTYVTEILKGENGGDYIVCDDLAYIVRHDFIYFEDGLATLNYSFDIPAPYNMNENVVNGDLTSSEMTTILNNKVFTNIIKENTTKKNDNIMMIIAIGIIICMVAGFYFLYDQNQLLFETMENNKIAWESIRDSIVNNGVE